MPLPVINNDIYSISYSGLRDFNKCPHYFFLRNVKRLYRYESTVDTIFGKLIHKSCQNILQNSDKQALEAHLTTYERTWKRFMCLYKKKLASQAIKINTLHKAGGNILNSMESASNKALHSWSVVSVEHKLSLPITLQWPQKFKGYIDIIFDIGSGKYVVADFKTCGSVFWFKKEQDKFKDYQLTLYKYFWCKERNINPDNVETYFILLEKNPKSKNSVVYSRVTSGNKKVQNALDWLDNTLRNVNKGTFLKNRTACVDKFGHECSYYKKECT